MSFLFVDKPGGIPTHATETGPGAPVGFVEYLSSIAGEKLFVNHRLDKGTTGALVFARNEAAAAQLAESFNAREIEKTYLFVTDRKAPSSTEFSVKSFIEKRGSKFVSEQSETNEANSETDFRLLLTHEQFSLWEARPKTGKSHQIRLHAFDSGIPILGDQDHGGTPFPALCLHSLELKFRLDGKETVHRCPPPIFFNDLKLVENVRLCTWLAAFDRRTRWLESRAQAAQVGNRSELLDLNAWRALHNEDEHLRAEVLGEVTDLQWFSEEAPAIDEWNDIHELVKLTHAQSWRLHLRHDRGRKPQGEDVWASRPEPPTRWFIHENGIRYEMRSDTGLSSGLFLDQRANRLWVRENANGKSVLNLFSYTSGFSVAAAKGGATKTVSVDLSKNFLEWSKRNFALNEIPVDAHEFRAIESREYLKWAKKKALNFDLVICDPPSFSRSDKGVFSIEKDLGSLLAAVSDVTQSGGIILFCANYEGWYGTNDFREAITAEIKQQKLPLTLSIKKWAELLPPDLDFELPGEARLMKSLLIEKL
jgi:23S rRNA (cytosine1962-C5)-methyltransferase